MVDNRHVLDVVDGALDADGHASRPEDPLEGRLAPVVDGEATRQVALHQVKVLGEADVQLPATVTYIYNIYI